MGDVTDEIVEASGVSLVTVLPLPTPWPLASDVVASRDDSKRMMVILTAEGRIKAVVHDEYGDVLAIGESARIRLRGLGHAHTILTATWDPMQRDIKLYVNGSLTSARTRLIRLQATPDPLKSGFPRPQRADHKSEEARKSREQRAVDYRRNKIDEGRQENNLRREVRLLEAALKRLQGGQLDDLVSVSLHLRKIIGRGKGNHALQDHAALRGLKLDVWTLPPPDRDVWTPKKLRSLELWWGEMFSPDQTPLFSWAIDLDAWLSQAGGVIAGEHLNNDNLLHAIADKIGAHLDVGATPTLDRMGQVTIFGTDLVTRYLTELGSAVLALSYRTLRP